MTSRSSSGKGEKGRRPSEVRRYDDPDFKHLVGFFSYKGGVGRTVFLCNAALAMLQRMGAKGAAHGVFCVDLDLAAPGILAILGLESDKSAAFLGILRGLEPPVQDSVVQLSGFPLYILAERTPDIDSLNYLAKIFAGDVAPKRLQAAFDFLRDRGRHDFFAPFTLVDLGSGLGELPGKVFKTLDQLVLVARADRQHREALPLLLTGFHRYFENLGYLPSIHLVLNQLPSSWLDRDSAGLLEFLKASQLDDFLNHRGQFEHQTGKRQNRTLEIAPLVEAALTDEIVLLPESWVGSAKAAAAADADPTKNRQARIRPADDEAEKRLRDAAGALAEYILDGE